MSNTRQFTKDGITVNLHFKSDFSGKFIARFSGSTLETVVDGKNIHIRGDTIGNFTLAHAWAHVLKARRHGWRYIPLLIWEYLRYGYENSPSEKDCDTYADTMHMKFPVISLQFGEVYGDQG